MNREQEYKLRMLLSKTDPDQYYPSVFEKIKSGKKNVWNWSAFLFPVFWLCYRNMFAESFLLAFLGSFAAVLFTTYELSGSVFCLVLTVLILIFAGASLGLYGNYLYYNEIRRKHFKRYHLYRNYKATALVLTVLFILMNYAASFGISCAISGHDSYEIKMTASAFFLMLFLHFIPCTIMLPDLIRQKTHERRTRGSKEVSEDSLNDEKILSFVATNSTDAWLKKFKELDAGAVFSLNLGSLFGFGYFLYKQMYVYAVMLLAVILSVSTLAYSCAPATVDMAAISIFTLGLHVVGTLGVANRLYYYHLKKKARKMLITMPYEPEIIEPQQPEREEPKFEL